MIVELDPSAGHFAKASEVVAAFADLPAIDVDAYLADIDTVAALSNENDRDVWS